MHCIFGYTTRSIVDFHRVVIEKASKLLIINILFLRYEVVIEGTSHSTTVTHPTSDEPSRVTATITGLSPGQTYTVIIYCKVQGERSSGSAPTLTATTCEGRYCSFIHVNIFIGSTKLSLILQ